MVLYATDKAYLYWNLDWGVRGRVIKITQGKEKVQRHTSQQHLLPQLWRTCPTMASFHAWRTAWQMLCYCKRAKLTTFQVNPRTLCTIRSEFRVAAGVTHLKHPGKIRIHDIFACLPYSHSGKFVKLHLVTCVNSHIQSTWHTYCCKFKAITGSLCFAHSHTLYFFASSQVT